MEEGSGSISIVRLKEAEKRQLVALVHIRKVASQYQIIPETLRHYTKRVNKGIPLFEQGGRPGKLDQKSIEKLIIFLQTNRNTDITTIYKQIRDESRFTFSRKYPNIVLEIRRKLISSLTVRRWTKNLLLIVFNSFDPML